MTMTMPDERARALRFAGEILREMRSRKDVPEDLKQQARMTLRHYPDPADLLQMIQDVDRMPRDFLDQHWLAPEVRTSLDRPAPGSSR
ncbi:MAG: BPSL0761 family protein [Hydrogenophaga sp.]|nr:BPSL0761 family protein [Hydrogenophaga sp.]